MRAETRSLPIGIQSFEQLISDGYLYVDKTDFIYHLVHTGKSYFLIRPRRFGKSLLLSTLKAYWEGKKELFRDLKIEELEKGNPNAWQPYPVFYIDFNQTQYITYGSLEAVLNMHLKEWEGQYGETSKEDPLGARFGKLLKIASEQTGKRCVVLVDEYDKSLLDAMDRDEILDYNRNVFKGFFSTLKSYDAYIQFIFITGVTKFSKVSIFSDLNNLRDISLEKDYAQICGITDTELSDYFKPEMRRMAKEQGMTMKGCKEELKRKYDGYLFHEKGKRVYNPFSLMNALVKKEYGSYWFETGTPTFLVNHLKKLSFDTRQFMDGTLKDSKETLIDYRDDIPDPVPLLYQTGYLTILNYDPSEKACVLGFPNEEVKYGFLNNLLPAYVNDVRAGSGKDILTLTRYIKSGDPDRIKNVFVALFASISYTTEHATFEHYFQTVIFITLTLLGQFVECEKHTSVGRIDCTLKTDRFVYIFEFKIDKSADEALEQINDKHYADPYAADPRKLYKIGVNFDSKTRQLDDWKVEE